MPQQPDEAARIAVEHVAQSMKACPGEEAEVLTAFIEAFAAELAGWDARLEELERYYSRQTTQRNKP